MVKITVSADCGNSPKKLFLKQLNIAFAEGDLAFVADSVTEDIAWHIVGDRRIQGKDDFVEALEQMKDRKAAALIISKVITHGKEGAVNGEIKMMDGKNYAYCDVYEFKGAKGASIKSIQSYVIEIGDD
jgi:hypothetical protein